MNYIAYSLGDPIAVSVVGELRGIVGFEEVEQREDYSVSRSDNLRLVALHGQSIRADFLDGIGAERITFISRHSSASGTTSFTSHANGNWSNSSDYGGKPKELSVSSPRHMLAFLTAVQVPAKSFGLPVSYEATHHGPLLDTPSLFVEIGPLEGHLSTERARAFATSVIEMFDADPHYDKVAIGVGGLHYPERFTRLALSGKYAFSHIMSKYYVNETDMLEKSIERSEERVEIAVIDWKSMRSEQRSKVIAELDRIGMDYEKA